MNPLTALCLLAALAMTGCSPKPPVSLQSDRVETVNKNLFLGKRVGNVPKDPSFQKQRYSYIIHAEKKRDVYFDNKIFVKAFYLLHHANLVVITGNCRVASQYKHYLKHHGVTAKIKLSCVDIDSNEVMIDTIHYSPLN